MERMTGKAWTLSVVVPIGISLTLMVLRGLDIRNTNGLKSAELSRLSSLQSECDRTTTADDTPQFNMTRREGARVSHAEHSQSSDLLPFQRNHLRSVSEWFVRSDSTNGWLSYLTTSFLQSSPWYFPELWVTDFPSFNSARLDAQIRLYSAYLAEFGSPDVLIVGSSRSLQGIDPVVLQDDLEKQGYPNLQVYNLSVNGATAQVVDFMLREVLTPEQLPELVIWGDGSRAFNSARRDATFEQIKASRGYAAVQRGDRPIRYPFRYPIINRLCFDLPPNEGEQVALLRITSAPNSMASVGEANQMVDHSWIPHIARQPHDPCDRRQEILRELGTVNGLAADAHLIQQQWVKQYGDGLTARGFSPVMETFEPSTYYQTYTRVPGAYDASYVNFDLAGVQTQAADRLARYLGQHQIPLVFVNLPLSADYLDAFRQQRENLFLQYLAGFAQTSEVWVRDLNQPELSPNPYFADPSHINQVGAQAIARHLAHDTSIPWPTTR